MTTITFIGAAREVTGSCYLVETDNTRFLVDCGMVQGGHDAPLRNRRAFPFAAQDIDFVLLTHAHIDHCGLLPKLMRDGFSGPIYSTRATADLLTVMLPDSGHIQEYDAKRAAKHRSVSHKKLLTPLYTVQDALDCLELVKPINYDERIQVHPGVTCRFRDAGHILGSAIIEIWINEGDTSKKLVFSGDLGQPGQPILRDPTLIDEADILVMESTYGNRSHKNLPTTLEELVQVVDNTLHKQQGNVIVPAFAVGRTQEVIYHLHQLTRQGRLRNLNIFVDSPMATAVTRITQQHMALFDDQAKQLASWHAAGNDLPNLHFVASTEESMALNQIRSGALIISASGMCDAGRIRHHLRHNLGRRECSVMITGFQAQGTLGRRLVDGAKQVTIFGERIPVRAAIHTLGGFSAHADQSALLAWAGAFKRPPRQTFVVHGEASAALTFGEHLHSEFGWNVMIPEPGQSMLL
ncbi:MBL fold metallo-hydrolase RNA specificity domain-containing protein [Sedimenticola selenatireducens]|uniref:MBL fold metallo-hydrolase n=1 Tax=Sedimenticola selenatireducens TaxID=191960 RepID=A0A558DIK5_9GAMM|nr:MBL fold metallo-hydrolase [Sedimenticola selenatireducens]TVO67826.1 MBL fold metallo-hydrolase [Sedimenticola selenatireducens]TVT60837.1 MAG: MBL fold metallo-hydrolase [Sedimenticola selenatireducens]